MAEVTRRRQGELIRSLFGILSRYPEGLPAKDALQALRNAISLSEFEQGVYESGYSRFDKVVRFATIAPVKAGWLVKSKGVWQVTEL